MGTQVEKLTNRLSLLLNEAKTQEVSMLSSRQLLTESLATHECLQHLAGECEGKVRVLVHQIRLICDSRDIECRRGSGTPKKRDPIDATASITKERSETRQMYAEELSSKWVRASITKTKMESLLKEKQQALEFLEIQKIESTRIRVEKAIEQEQADELEELAERCEKEYYQQYEEQIFSKKARLRDLESFFH